MQENLLPELNVVPLGRVSPSRYASLLRCQLREIWASARHRPLLPVSPAARLGSVAHKVLELASQGRISSVEELQEAWDRQVKSTEAEMLDSPTERHLIPLNETAYKYEVKKQLTLTAAWEIIASRTKPGHSGEDSFSATAEAWLQTKDGKVGGYVDAILNGKDGPEIVDYKTGGVTEPNGDGESIKDEYEIQLSLYAALHLETRGNWPSKLALKTLDGTVHQLPFNHTRSLKLVADAKVKLEDINRRIGAGDGQEQFASPSPTTCRFCVYRPACRTYWSTRDDQEEWPQDVCGNLMETKRLGNGSIRAVVKTRTQTVAIRGLPPERFGFLLEEKGNLIICNLRPDSSEGFYIATPLSFGYGLGT